MDDFLFLLWTVVKILLITVPLILCVAFLTLAERRVIGFMQGRMGPNRVGPWGLFQPFADVIKLLMKEIIVPEKANRFLFILAPMLTLIPAFVAWAVIPFDEERSHVTVPEDGAATHRLPTGLTDVDFAVFSSLGEVFPGTTC